MLDGYAFANVGSGWLIGRVQYEEKDAGGRKALRRYLSPVYEAQAQYQFNGETGQMNMQCLALPVLGSPTIRSIDLPPTAVFVKCEDLSGKEKERWSNAIQQAEGLVQAIRTTDAGLVQPTRPRILEAPTTPEDLKAILLAAEPTP